jgi:hypothetical protein
VPLGNIDQGNLQLSHWSILKTSTLRPLQWGLCAAAAYGMDVPSTEWQFREQSENDPRQQSNNYAHSLTPNCQKIQKYLHWKADQSGLPGPLGVKDSGDSWERLASRSEIVVYPIYWSKGYRV